MILVELIQDDVERSDIACALIEYPHKPHKPP